MCRAAAGGGGGGGGGILPIILFPPPTMTSAELSVAFFLQMFFVLAACRPVGWVARRCGQPQVIGEMIAGVVIGPSLFGLFWPGAQQFLFPPESLKTLYVFAQL